MLSHVAGDNGGTAGLATVLQSGTNTSRVHVAVTTEPAGGSTGGQGLLAPRGVEPYIRDIPTLYGSPDALSRDLDRLLAADWGIVSRRGEPLPGPVPTQLPYGSIRGEDASD